MCPSIEHEERLAAAAKKAKKSAKAKKPAKTKRK